MKALTVAVLFFAFCFASSSSVAEGGYTPRVDGSSKPQDGEFHHAAMKSRVDRSLLERNAAVVAQSTANIRLARRARQHCISDFTTICSKDAPLELNNASGRPRRFQLHGMEACLTEHLEEVKNPQCVSYLKGRAACFVDATSICKNQIEEGMVAHRNGDAQASKKSRRASRSSDAFAGEVGGAVVSRQMNAAARAIRFPLSLPEGDKEQFVRDRLTMICLRESDKTLLSAECQSSQYYTAIAAYGASSRRGASDVLRGLRR